jgi:hypothetical protein
MKTKNKIWFTLIIIMGVSIMLTSSCKKADKGSDETFGYEYGYEYYKGAIPNSYYIINMYGERALKVTGKPFMILKYTKLTHYILDCEFGLSEITQSQISGTQGEPWEPTLDASMFEKKLNLVSPVDLLVEWTLDTRTITNGSLGAGGVIFSFSDVIGITWTFSYLPAGSLTGGVKNLNNYGMETDSENSFVLNRL